MYSRKSTSTNYKILKSLLSKLRELDYTEDVAYITIYTFLYKYCSDSLEEHFLSVIQDKELTLSEAYQDSKYRLIFKEDALNMFGYHMESPEGFINEVINNNYSDRFFISEFFNAFSSNASFFKGKNYEKYFNFIFDAVRKKVDFRKLDFDTSRGLLLKEIILSISKLDLYDNEFGFVDVFEEISRFFIRPSKLNPDYLTNIFSAIVSSQKDFGENVYDPFCNNASSLINLSNQFHFQYSYGKEPNELYYCFNIVRLLIHYFNLEYVFLENDNALDSVDIDGVSFDVIVSKIPNMGKYNSYPNKTQNLELSKRNKRNELEEVLRLNFDMDKDSFSKDSDLNNALENLIEKMNFEKDFGVEFSGEYESLKDNEFLFLINLISSLKNDGMMVVSISQNFLFKNSLTTLRKYLTYEKNFIDAIISLPIGFGSRIRPEVIIVFKKDRSSDDILFIDMSKDSSTKVPSRIVPGVFRRNLLLSDESIKKLVDVYQNKSDIDKFSNVVGIDVIESNNFNLSISRYVDTYEGEFVKLDNLKDEKEEISNNINSLNEKIDALMDELNIKF